MDPKVTVNGLNLVAFHRISVINMNPPEHLHYRLSWKSIRTVTMILDLILVWVACMTV